MFPQKVPCARVCVQWGLESRHVLLARAGIDVQRGIHSSSSSHCNSHSYNYPRRKNHQHRRPARPQRERG